MPNTFLKPETISRTALGLLRRELILPRLVTRLGIEEFRGAKNDTVNVHVPSRLTAREYEWRTRTNPIVLDDMTESSVPVVLDSHPYSAVAVTDEELTLDIADFGAQVLNPQVLAVAEELESLVAAAIEGAPYDPAKVVDYAETADGAGADEAPRGMEFLYSLNRLNVATSRAQCLAVVVASPALLRVSCRMPRQMRLVNALARVVEVAWQAG